MHRLTSKSIGSVSDPHPTRMPSLMSVGYLTAEKRWRQTHRQTHRHTHTHTYTHEDNHSIVAHFVGATIKKYVYSILKVKITRKMKNNSVTNKGRRKKRR